MELIEDPSVVYNKLQENNLYKKSFNLAKMIVITSRELVQKHNEYILSKQLIRSGTLIGANIAEANGGISISDFSYKISIAYKESLETKYWLDLLKAVSLIDNDTHIQLFQLTDEVSRILFSILRKTRINKPKN